MVAALVIAGFCALGVWSVVHPGGHGRARDGCVAAASSTGWALIAGYERVKARRDGSPLVQLSLFRDRAFSVGMAIALTFFLGIASFALVLTLFLQLGLGFTPLHAGLTFLPFSAGVLVASGAAARLAPRFGRGVTMAGALIIAGGMAGLMAIVHHCGAP